MSQIPPPAGNTPSRPEFIALMAMLVATIAFSLDAMLPGMPAIAADLSPQAPDLAHLIVPAFVLGMGVGTISVGPLADAYGRKPVLVGFSILYCLSSALAWAAGSLEMLLAARLLQGIGASGPRIVAMTVIRDRFAGRDMARLMSFIMMVFSLVPAIAPAFGAMVIGLTGWRTIFLVFILFSSATVLWFWIRQPETLRPDYRRPLNLKRMVDGARETVNTPVTWRAILVQTLIFGMLFGNLSTVQPVMDRVFGQGHLFPLWFALIAGCGALMGLVNARLVTRHGMRKVILAASSVQVTCTLLFLGSGLIDLGTGWAGFAAYYLWAMSIFLLVAFTLGNLNAMALEPLGHLAGTATSVVTAVSTIAAALLAVPLSIVFSESSLQPLALVMLVYCGAAVFLMWRMPLEQPVDA